jgi:pimeloyl-ACP methyl ester carboxylesterase
MTQPAATTPDQPAEAFCDTTQLSYLQAGAGAGAAVLLHGIGASKEIWWWTLVALAPLGRAFALDLPGHGGSPHLSDAGMAQIAARVADFCDARGLTSIALVGHSMGGNIALELTLARPALVRRLVLVDPAARASDLPIYANATRVNNFQRWAAFRTSMALAQKVGRVGRHVPRWLRGGFVLPALRRASYLARHDVGAMQQQLDSLIASPISTRLAEIHVPTLVISGEFDPLVPPAYSRRVAEAIPGARYAVVRRAGHNPMDERPQAFEQTLLGFLQETTDHRPQTTGQ